MNSLTKWFQYCTRNFSPQTVELYKGRLQYFDDFLVEQGRQLSTEAIEDYLDYGLELGWTRRYVNVNLTAIKSYCKWFANREHIENPAEPIRMLKENEPNRRVLSEEEYEKVLLVAQYIDRDIISFLCNTGLRVSEFNSLKWENIAPDVKSLKVIGKGNKARTIPLNPTCREILFRHKSLNGNGDGKLPITRGTRYQITQICTRLAKQADIPKFGPHAMRHFFSTQLLKKGVPILLVSKILGHASVKTTEAIYCHLVPADLLGITDILDS
jgi:integrase